MSTRRPPTPAIPSIASATYLNPLRTLADGVGHEQHDPRRRGGMPSVSRAKVLVARGEVVGVQAVGDDRHGESAEQRAAPGSARDPLAGRDQVQPAGADRSRLAFLRCQIWRDRSSSSRLLSCGQAPHRAANFPQPPVVVAAAGQGGHVRQPPDERHVCLRVKLAKKPFVVEEAGHPVQGDRVHVAHRRDLAGDGSVANSVRSSLNRSMPGGERVAGEVLLGLPAPAEAVDLAHQVGGGLDGARRSGRT